MYSTPGLSNFEDVPSSPASISSAKRRQDTRQSIDSAIASCLEAIAGYQNTLRNLSARRNLCADTSILPDEVLAEIMWFTVPKGSDDGAQRGSLAVLPLSHVSRHWRDVAMSYPRLWSYIAMRCVAVKEARESLLDRAKSYPLTLHVSWTDIRSPRQRQMIRSGWTELLRHPLQVQTLTLHPGLNDYDGVVPYILKRLCASSPNLDLRYLDLDIEYSYRKELPVFAFPNLTDLKLSIAGDSSIQSTLWLVKTLQALPELQKLTLIGAFLPSVVSSTDDQHEPISLPHLTNLLVVGRMSHLKWILERIVIPPSADVEVSCLSQYGKKWRDHPAVAAILARLLSSRMAGERVLLPHTFSAYDFLGHTAALCLNAGPGDESQVVYRMVLSPLSPIPSLPHGKVILNLQANKRQHIEEIWDALPLDSIHTLLLFEGTASDDVWNQHLGQGFVARTLVWMRAVRSLLTQWSPELLKSLLLPEERPDQPLFPGMNVLALLGGVRARMPGPGLKEVLTELEAERGPLGGIFLAGWDVPEDAVEGLKSPVLRAKGIWPI
ncbi:hypothetical protein EIP91_004021 [Steccherinum ochraceum]|uniref:Uncharacterized protein n=1 Tax=Steccherinum ochraceum TaxID=92696 RepID=A0A4R0RCS7_9APHY|nr:hypothetical protein EIP91_004021 [Steccherinum ochraceum]